MIVLLSAGEVSGDIVGAHLAGEIGRRDPAAQMWGVGGERMRAAGVDVLTATSELGRVGVTEAFSAFAPFLRIFLSIRRRVRREKPDVAILIANDVFNVILGVWLRMHRVRTVAAFPPQVWIWRAMAPLFARAYDAVAACFPEEQHVYERHVKTRFVGHYLADLLQQAGAEERLAARRECGAEDGEVLLGVLPGSRGFEISQLAPLLFTAVREATTGLRVRVVVARADTVAPGELATLLDLAGLAGRVEIVEDSHALMRGADLLLMASGTATLEASLIGTPMIVAYRVSRMTAIFCRIFVRLGWIDEEYIALPNVLLRERVVPDFLQEKLTLDGLRDELVRLLNDAPARERMRAQLQRVRPLVAGDGSISRTIDLAFEGMRTPAVAPARSMVAERAS